LSLYRHTDDFKFAAVVDPTAKLLREHCDGVPLFGEEVDSLPSFDQLWVSDSALLDKVLRATGHTREDAESEYFRGSREIADYEREAHRLCPLYAPKSEGLYAVLGGWHVLWPEDDSYDRDDSRLVLWTFHKSEPWVEVWSDNAGSLSVIPRIT
jgi:hypothetical protein